MTKQEALEALDRIFNHCEEINLNIPKEERSGYKMLPDIWAIRDYIYSPQEEHDGCCGCAFESVEEWEMPCVKCKQACKDYWRARSDEE